MQPISPIPAAVPVPVTPPQADPTAAQPASGRQTEFVSMLAELTASAETAAEVTETAVTPAPCPQQQAMQQVTIVASSTVPAAIPDPRREEAEPLQVLATDEVVPSIPAIEARPSAKPRHDDADDAPESQAATPIAAPDPWPVPPATVLPAPSTQNVTPATATASSAEPSPDATAAPTVIPTDPKAVEAAAGGASARPAATATPQPILVKLPEPQPAAAETEPTAADGATSPPPYWHVRSTPADTAGPATATTPDIAPLPDIAPTIGGVVPAPAPPSTAITAPNHHATQPPSHNPLPTDLGTNIAHIAKAEAGEPVDIRLSPEELGRLRIRVWTDTDTVRVTVQAERPETLDLLRRNGETLMKEFRAAGFAGGSLDFSGWSGGDAPPSQTPPAPADNFADTSFTAPVPAQTPAAMTTENGLNLRL